jgi:chorismate mutase
MYCRGIRGATTVDANQADVIQAATQELLEAIVSANGGLRPEDIASIFFTTTPDLDAAFPAQAARRLGWNDTALLCCHEIGVPNSLPMCIRVLVHWNTDRRQNEIVHVYLKGAETLRPDKKVALRAAGGNYDTPTDSDR